MVRMYFYIVWLAFLAVQLLRLHILCEEISGHLTKHTGYFPPEEFKLNYLGTLLAIKRISFGLCWARILVFKFYR